MKRITITGVVDLDGESIDRRDIETILDDIRAYGTAEVTNVEEIAQTPELPYLKTAKNWQGY